jgi:uncharacterized membrane protein
MFWRTGIPLVLMLCIWAVRIVGLHTSVGVSPKTFLLLLLLLLHMLGVTLWYRVLMSVPDVNVHTYHDC